MDWTQKKLISRRWPDVYIFGLTTEKKKNSRNENVDSHLFAFGRPSANIKTILKIIASLRTIWRQSCFYCCFYCAYVWILTQPMCIGDVRCKIGPNLGLEFFTSCDKLVWHLINSAAINLFRKEYSGIFIISLNTLYIQWFDSNHQGR